jgi:hypothetical protein
MYTPLSIQVEVSFCPGAFAGIEFIVHMRVVLLLIH